MSHILDTLVAKKCQTGFGWFFLWHQLCKKLGVAPTTNPIRMLLFSLGGQFENTFLGLGVRVEVICTFRLQAQFRKSG